jgi:NitT/TauT family transport system permease protein
VQLQPLLSVPLERICRWPSACGNRAGCARPDPGGAGRLWEAVARYQNNDLLLPSFLQTAVALWDGLLSGELLAKVGVSLVVLIKGYLLGIVLAFGLTSWRCRPNWGATCWAP